MDKKTCTKCTKEKPVEAFTKKDGKASSWCKDCYRAYVKERGYNDDAYAKNPEYFRTWQREFRKTTEYKTYNRAYRNSYKVSFAGTVTDLLCAARDRAKRRGLEIDLDREWVEQHLTALKCEATGVDLVLEMDKNVQHTPFRPSIDRMDNHKGYTKDNCRVVSVIYNKAKSDYDEVDVLRMAQALVRKAEVSCLDSLCTEP